MKLILLLVSVTLFSVASLILKRNHNIISTQVLPVVETNVKTAAFYYPDPPFPTVDVNGTWSLATQGTTGLDPFIRGWTWHPGPNSASAITKSSKYYTTWYRVNPLEPNTPLPAYRVPIKPTDPKNPPLPVYPPIQPGTVSKLLQNDDNTSVVFYGSSHVREIMFALLRIEFGMDMFGMLSHNVTYLPSGSKHLDPVCNPGPSTVADSYFGVDMNKCGWPAKRIMKELSSNVAFGFKTFLHTPQADSKFLEFLSSESYNLRHPDIIIMDVGIWGVRGNKLANPNTTTFCQTVLTGVEEWDYYMDWIYNSFPKSHIVLVYEGPSHSNILNRFQTLKAQVESKAKQQQQVVAVAASNNITATSTTITTTTSSSSLEEHQKKQKQQRQQQQVSIIRKDILLQRRPPSMPCEHGCAGPVINTIAVQLIEWLQERNDALKNQ